MTKTAWVVEFVWTDFDESGTNLLAVSLTEDGAYSFADKYKKSEEYFNNKAGLEFANVYVTEVDLV